MQGKRDHRQIKGSHGGGGGGMPGEAAGQYRQWYLEEYMVVGVLAV